MSAENTSKLIVKSMVIIHLLICLSVVIMVGTLYTLTLQSGKHLEPSEEFKILELLVPLIGVTSFFGVRFVINRKMKAIDQSANLEIKIAAYRSSMILLWAVLEGTTLFGSIGYYVSGRQNLLLYGLMAGVFILYFRPLKTKMAQDLDLQPNEVEELNQL